MYVYMFVCIFFFLCVMCDRHKCIRHLSLESANGMSMTALHSKAATKLQLHKLGVQEVSQYAIRDIYATRGVRLRLCETLRDARGLRQRNKNVRCETM